MSREHLKCSLPLPTGHIVGKMHMSSKCTQHVITGFQVPSPPVLGKAGWRIGELMGENRAYPLWLYPRIHVHSRDPTGSLRTSSDWTIKQTTWSPIGDISVPTISHQTPICQRPSPLGETQPPVLSLLSVWFIFGYVSRSLSFPLFHPITHSPFTPVSSFH